MHEDCGATADGERWCWRCVYFMSYWGRSIDWRGTLMLNAAFLLPFAVVWLLR